MTTRTAKRHTGRTTGLALARGEKQIRKDKLTTHTHTLLSLLSYEGHFALVLPSAVLHTAKETVPVYFIDLTA